MVSMNADPFQILEIEHVAALQALDRLEKAARCLRTTPASIPDREAVREVLGVLTGAIQDHNQKEEDALFPLLAEAAPTAFFEAEHRTLWKLERELAMLLDAGPADRIVDVAMEIVRLLRHHISRENEVLFPMARAILGPTGVDVLRRRLEEAAHGVASHRRDA